MRSAVEVKRSRILYRRHPAALQTAPTMNVFDTHRQVLDDYATYIRSFIHISDPQIAATVESSLAAGRLWPQPLLQFNPAYEKAGPIKDIVATGLLHDDAGNIFEGYELYRHQRDAVALGVAGTDFVVTSGTGSGKSLTYIGYRQHSCRNALQGAGLQPSGGRAEVGGHRTVKADQERVATHGPRGVRRSS